VNFRSPAVPPGHFSVPATHDSGTRRRLFPESIANGFNDVNKNIGFDQLQGIHGEYSSIFESRGYICPTKVHLMIQRIQSLFLLLVVAGLIAYLLMPFWIKSDPGTESRMVFTPVYMKLDRPGNTQPSITFTPYIYCGIGALVSIAIAVAGLLQYRNRLTQIKLGMINSIVMSLVLFFSAWLAMKGQRELMPGVGTFKAGLFAPVFSMIFNTLANRFIKKDEDLVRSVDRIR
jgi:hypothetical protein